MARPTKKHNARRVNTYLSGEVHKIAQDRAQLLKLKGGFSEYVTRLILADRNTKGRRVMGERAA